jgi:hypothetical protein
MKTFYTHIENLPGQTAMTEPFGGDCPPCSAIANSGVWARDKTIESLLDEIFQCPSNALPLRELAAYGIAIPPGFAGGIEDLTDVSAEMRGLVFRAYARRITGLLTAGRAAGQRPSRDRRLH